MMSCLICNEEPVINTRGILSPSIQHRFFQALNRLQSTYLPDHTTNSNLCVLIDPGKAEPLASIFHYPPVILPTHPRPSHVMPSHIHSRPVDYNATPSTTPAAEENSASASANAMAMVQRKNTKTSVFIAYATIIRDAIERRRCDN